MTKSETHLIPENIMPKGATVVGVYNSQGSKVGYIPFGRTSRPTGEPDYSVCVLSDIHVYEDTYPTSTEDFIRALTYANANCDFTCIAGDLVSTGGQKSQLANYASLVAQYSPDKPVYAIAGNHENYDGYADGTRGHHLRTYTGHPLYYSFGVRSDGSQVVTEYPSDDLNYVQPPIEYDDTVRDVFIMVGHWGAYRGDGAGWKSNEFVSVEELQWLYETLEANRNKRCFVFNHVLPHEHGVGNPNGLYKSALIWKTTDGGIGQEYISLLKHYKNVLFFHGHSHTRFDLQDVDPKANYGYVSFADGSGYKSIHIPSLAVPRDIDADGSPKPLEDLYAESEGYIMEVYPNYIVLNGRDFVGGDEDGHWSALGTYKIDTTLQTVEAGTFVDNTGLITT